MVIAIVGIVAGMTLPFMVAAIDSWSINRSEREVLFSARLATNRMLREIRQIKETISINTFSSTEFEFIDLDDNLINFQQFGTALLRNSQEFTDKLEDPGGLTFTYLDANGNVTAISADIRMVRINLILTSGKSAINIQSLARFRRE